MALTQKEVGKRNFIQEVKLLDSQEGTTNGEWFKLRGRTDVSIHFDGLVDGIVQIRASNDYSDNLVNTDDGVQIGADISSNQIIVINSFIKYIKIKKTVAGTDSVTATLICG